MNKPTLIDSQNFAFNQTFYFSRLKLGSDFILHRHNFAEMEYISGGHGYNIIDGKKYELKKGAVTFLMPWHVHEITVDKGSPLEINKCSFRIDFEKNGNALLNSVCQIIMDNGNYCPVAYYSEKEQQEFDDIFGKAYSISQTIEKYKETSLASLVSLLVISFFKKADKMGETAFTVNDVIRYLETEYKSRETNLKKVSEVFGFSESYISKLFPSETGLSFSETLEDIRVRNAAYLLMYTDYPVEQIAKWVGYSGKSGLYASFIKFKGMNPSDFRENNKKENVSSDSLAYSYTNSKIIYYMYSHYNEDLTLDSISHVFHYSKNYLSKILANDGTTFTDLLSEIRIYYACKELLLSSDSNEDISYNVGFRSVETFYRAFKKYRNMTPNEYRKANQCL